MQERREEDKIIMQGLTIFSLKSILEELKIKRQIHKSRDSSLDFCYYPFILHSKYTEF